MENQIKVKVDELMDTYLKTLQELVAIESVLGEAQVDAPFGEMPKVALDKALEISNRLGFETTLVDNAVGYASYGTSSKEYLGIFGHVDVVEVGTGWSYPPLAGIIDNGKIYGRGVLDNKGPILLNLFALYLLKELGIKFPYEVRVVFGSNEETGMKDIPIYLSKHKPPFFGWTPDCKFPVIYGERGRALLRINQGSADMDLFYNTINTYFLQARNNGEALGINYKDDDFGEMILRGYKLGFDTQSFFTCAVSYPGCTSVDEILTTVQSKLDSKLECLIVNNTNPVLKEKDSKYIDILSEVYGEITGLDSKPLTTTGGTYSKLIPNIVAFGPSFPGQNGIAHLPDEWMDLEDIRNCFNIYALSLYKLSQVNN